MTRINRKMVQKRLDLLNDIFGYNREPYFYEFPEEKKGLKGNHGTFVLDPAYGGYILAQMSCSKGGTGERNLSPRVPLRQVYDIINAWIDSAEQMKQQIKTGRDE